MTDFASADCGIRQLYARYVDAVWRKDADAFADCFADEAEWKIARMQLRGREEIRAAIAKLLAKYERVLMTLHTPLLDVEQKTATGRLFCVEYGKLLDGTSAMTVGVYYDRYVENGGRWRFTWRHYALHYRGPTDFSAKLFSSRDYGPFPAMPGPDEATISS